MSYNKVVKKGLDFIGVTITFICHDGKGNFVMAKRSANARDEQGTWDNGGGGVEFGEKIEDCLRKEIREEYSAEVLDYEFLGYRDVHRIQNGKPSHWIALDFKVLVDPAQVKIGEPHKFDDIGWFTIDNLPSPLHSQVGAHLERHRDKLKA
jgi:8-oxo-dGTP pyrophosphatase MutT (NUDIX family)